jgi:hypothetical protein
LLFLLQLISSCCRFLLVMVLIFVLQYIAYSGPPLSHILFADDVMLFCEASTEQVKVVMDILEEFCSASGSRGKKT